MRKNITVSLVLPTASAMSRSLPALVLLCLAFARAYMSSVCALTPCSPDELELAAAAMPHVERQVCVASIQFECICESAALHLCLLCTANSGAFCGMEHY